MRKSLVVLKTVLYIAFILLVIGFQTSVLPRFGLESWAPQLLFYVAATAAVFDGALAGALAGLVCGLFTDALCGNTLLYYTLFMSLLPAMIGYVSPGIFRRRIVTAFGWGLLLNIAVESGRFVFMIYLFNLAPFSALFTVVMPSVGIGAAMSLPVIALVRLIGRIGRRGPNPSLFRGRVR